MGRPRLYETPEARAAANRAKSKRCYSKYKTEINRRRRAYYRADNPDAVPQPSRQRAQKQNTVLCQVPSLDDITGSQTLVEFIDGLVQMSVATKDTANLSRPLAQLENLLKSLQDHEGTVLQDDGAGEKWVVARESTARMHRAVQAVEEIFCASLTGDLVAIHRAGQLMYQNW